VQTTKMNGRVRAGCVKRKNKGKKKGPPKVGTLKIPRDGRESHLVSREGEKPRRIPDRDKGKEKSQGHQKNVGKII